MHKFAIYLMLATIQAAALQAQLATAKVAVVNGQAVLFGTREGQKAVELLKVRYAASKKEFDSRQNEIAQLEDQLNKGGSVLTEDKRDQLADAINEKKKRLQRDAQDFDDDSQKDRQQALQPVGARIDATIGKFAAENGYAIVLDYSTPGSPVRYAETGADITKEVIALYDKTYGDSSAKGKP